MFSVDKKNQLDVTFFILCFSSNSCSTCFGKPCAVVTKSGSLNFLLPSGPVQACNGTALPFFYIFLKYVINVCGFLKNCSQF